MAEAPVLCAQCGAPLALADAACARCGRPVDPAERRVLLGRHAEAMEAAGRFDAAARDAHLLLALAPGPEEGKRWSRKRAAWLQRLGDPASLAAAADALRAGMLLDDADPLGHQLWVDLLVRLGRLDEARLHYKARLEKDPEDAVARRQIQQLSLLLEMKAAPPPEAPAKDAPQGMLAKLFEPTWPKIATAAIGCATCVFALVSGFFGGPSGAPGIPNDLQGTGADSLIKLAQDPWLNGFQIVAYGAYALWGWRTRRGR